NVARLEGGVLGAPPVREGDAVLPLRRERGEPRLLDRGNLRIVGVAQDKDMEFLRFTCGDEAFHHWLDVADDAFGILVAYAPEDCGLRGDRFLAGDARGHGC